MPSTSGRRRQLVSAGVAFACLVAAAAIVGSPAARAELDRRAYGEVLKKLDQAARSGADGAVASALRELAADDSARAVKVMAKVVKAMPQSTAVHDAVMDFVAELKDPKAWKELRKQVKRGKPWELRVVLVDAVGKHHGQAEVVLLGEATGDKVHRVALAAVRQLGALKTTPAVEQLVAAMQAREDDGKRDVVWQDMRNALGRTLGTKLDAAIDYQNLFRARQADFVEGRGIPASHDDGPSAGEIGSVTLFGEPIHCEKVVLILDVSGSMVIADPYPPGEGPGGTSAARDGGGEYDYVKDPERKRIYRARKELIKTLEGLAAQGAEANVIAYSTDVKMWKPEGVHKLGAENLKEAKAFVDAFVAEGVTATDTALMYAFERCKDADCFYLISDGFATHDGQSKVPSRDILERVAEANRLLKIQVNTLGFAANAHVDNDGADAELMTGLAAQTGGTYTEIR
jgi:hypothetical protein